jgi:PIN domain
MEIDWNKFSVVAFIDSNVALECLALEQLPWSEIHATGPILLLITPTVLKEVDSKKNHPRLGDHARRFNRTIRPLVGEQATVIVRQSPAPQVEMALADCARIDWQKYSELDPDEADSRIVAEALTTQGPSSEQRVVLVSQDIRPLSLAKKHGLQVYHISENWLRPKEKSESEKKAVALQREIDAIKSRQPNLKLSFRASKNAVILHRVSALSAEENKDIKNTIFRLHPTPVQKQDSNFILHGLNNYDYSLDERYEKWEKKVIPQFMNEYENKLELNFGQFEIFFRVENVGQVPAESLLVRLSVQGGWLNERYVLASPSGPSAPTARQNLHHLPLGLRNMNARAYVPPGKHEFVVQEKPKRSLVVQIMCNDFRHGLDYEYRTVAWVDPRAEVFSIEAVVTSANLYGELKETFTIEKTVVESSVYDLIDPEALKFLQPPEVASLLNEAIREENYSSFEFDGVDWDK